MLEVVLMIQAGIRDEHPTEVEHSHLFEHAMCFDPDGTEFQRIWHGQTSDVTIAFWTPVQDEDEALVALKTISQRWNKACHELQLAQHIDRIILENKGYRADTFNDTSQLIDSFCGFRSRITRSVRPRVYLRDPSAGALRRAYTYETLFSRHDRCRPSRRVDASDTGNSSVDPGHSYGTRQTSSLSYHARSISDVAGWNMLRILAVPALGSLVAREQPVTMSPFQVLIEARVDLILATEDTGAPFDLIEGAVNGSDENFLCNVLRKRYVASSITCSNMKTALDEILALEYLGETNAHEQYMRALENCRTINLKKILSAAEKNFLETVGR
ncbi:hypothetical protein [Nocardiopsis kunsanensis]|uniref:hypothetical protein n=1 Tax=Nocardiopsis kunsanensis TaxID=141693 RepID=UPI0018764E7D|nr:hypothetical protein [Nocardiopsis kunsanensis]